MRDVVCRNPGFARAYRARIAIASHLSLVCLLFAGCSQAASSESSVAQGDAAGVVEKTDGSRASIPDKKDGQGNQAGQEAAIAAASTAGASTEVADITFDAIKFPMEKNDQFQRKLITPSIEALSGKRIRIRGYMLDRNVMTQEGIEHFVLVRDNLACCFGPGAMLYDCIMINMNDGKTTSFATRVITVEGTFTIHENKFDDGTYYSIYQLDADSVK